MHPQESNSPSDDFPKDPEVLQWFHALGPPPDGPAPLDLAAKVQAQIVQQRFLWRLLVWPPFRELPRWVPVLAMGLLLSLGLNVWWGTHLAQSPGPDMAQDIRARQHDPGTRAPLSIYRFQAEIVQLKAVGTSLAARAPVKEPTAPVGFTPQAARAAFFQLGTLYADALALFASGALEAATQRLDALAHGFATVHTARPVMQYLHALQTLRASHQYSGEDLATFLALFEPLYDAADSGLNRLDTVALFRTGAWVENVSLAAAAGDFTALRRGGAALAGAYKPLTTRHLPPDLLAGLERLQHLAQQPTSTEEDRTSLQRLVQELQEEFSE